MNGYIEDRVTKQRKWYEAKATENKEEFLRFQTIIIILGASIPVLVAFESVAPTLKEWGGPIAAVISGIIAICAGLDKLKQPQPNWFNYRANEEMMKKEEWFYKYKAGPYKGVDDEKAEILFVERIEAIISADIARTTSVDQKKEDKNQGVGKGGAGAAAGGKPKSKPK
jgi:hypothetical protein